MFVSITHPRIRGKTTALLASVAVLAAMVPLATDAARAETPEQATARSAAAEWIVAELDSAEPSFDVFGATSARNDVIYALASAGGNEGAIRRAWLELKAGAAEYLGAAGTAEAGALGKVLLSTIVTGGDAADPVAGRDIEAELRAAIEADGSFAPDVFNHSMAMIGLGATDAGVPPQAATHLVDLQCDNGEFTFDGTCPGSTPDIDTTAIAIQALAAAAEVEATEAAAAFLVESQSPDGSFPNAFGDPNANTAGVAAHALRIAGEAEAASAAADFVVTLQTADGGFKFVAADTEPNGFATLQGILAFATVPLTDLATAPFADVTTTDLFATEIDWLGDEGISKGCDPPTNDNYCPDDPVTRGQMAAFLVRALDLTDTGAADFADDDGSIFEDDIRRLAAAGITKGCNPPTNDNYCPDDPVTRAEMAAFISRAWHR